MTYITPASGFILVKITETKQDTILVAIDDKKERQTRGVVVAIGKPARHVSGEFYESDVKVGDNIFFKPYAVEDLYLNNSLHMLIPFDNVRGTIHEK